MRSIGVNYDTGLDLEGRSTRSVFDRETARRELRTIAGELHAEAVRVTGSHPERLAVAGAEALEAGLELWYSPIAMDLEPDELVTFLTGAAVDAERLRVEAEQHAAQGVGEGAGLEVVLILGFEISLSCKGFVPGETMGERIATMMDPGTWSDPVMMGRMMAGLQRWGVVQEQLAAAAREVFGGRITYAAGMWEEVNWDLFDFVAVDAYRDAQNAATFRDELAGRLKWGKPLVVTEFGCCTFRGAADQGGTGWLIVDRSVDPPAIKGEYVRDEGEQVRYLRELAATFEEVGVEAAFWFSFAGYELPHRADDPMHDLDLSAYGLVAVDPDGGWRPKQVFHALGELNGS
ncbi:hypothetical protein GCM10009554_58370 [Kribbella koreensis]|uniref:Abortive infection protein n=2 Tax=Kribbella TaxID=182639 RepID=A0ABP6X3U0_9ACTN